MFIFVPLDNSELYYILGFPISDEKLYKARQKMNEYLKAFQKINQSSTQLLTNDLKSLEIKQAARELNKSLQPFYKELQESATRLKSYIQQSFEELDYADAVWDSKPRIAAAPKAEIWEHIGELSGQHFRIQQLSRQKKKEAITEAKEYWDGTIESLKNSFFTDGGGKAKKDIGFGEKDRFVKEIRFDFDSPFPLLLLRELLVKKFTQINQEVNNINIELISQCISRLDWKLSEKSQKTLTDKVNLLAKFTFNNCEAFILYEIQKFKEIVIPDLDILTKNWGNITWEQVVNCKEKVWLKMENTINYIFDERMNVATKAIDKAIAFYSDFLAKQERYEQETPEQRESEELWIKQQREELQRVKQGLEEILNPFSN